MIAMYSNVKTIRDNYVINSSEGYRISSKSEEELRANLNDIYEKKLVLVTVNIINSKNVTLYTDVIEETAVSVKVVGSNGEETLEGVISNTKPFEIKIESGDIFGIDIVSKEESKITAVYERGE